MSGKQVPPKWRRIPGLLMKYEKYAPACAFPGQQWQCGQRSYFLPDSFHQSETSSPLPPRSEGGGRASWKMSNLRFILRDRVASLDNISSQHCVQ